MAKYFVIRTEGYNSFEFRNQKPEGPLYVGSAIVPPGLENEDPRWLQIEAVEVEPGLFQDQVTIDQPTKDALLISDAEAEAQRLADEAAEANVNIYVNRIEFGKRMVAEISILNITKGWTTAQVVNFMKDPRVQGVTALLNNGAIGSARDTIVATDFTAYYTTEEKTGITDKLTAFLDAE